jgi:hypothetical protein
MIKSLLNGGAAAALVVALAVPAWSQTSPTQGPPTQQNGPAPPRATHTLAFLDDPGTSPAQVSHRLGPSHPSSDQSGVKGLPRSKSGTTVKPSDIGR